MTSHNFSPYILKSKPSDHDLQRLGALFPPEITRISNLYPCKAVFWHERLWERYAILRQGIGEDKRYFLVLLHPDNSPSLVCDEEGFIRVHLLRGGAEYTAKRLLQEKLDEMTKTRTTFLGAVRSHLGNMLADRYPDADDVSEVRDYATSMLGRYSPLRVVCGQNPVAMASVVLAMLQGEDTGLPTAVEAELLGFLHKPLPSGIWTDENRNLRLTLPHEQVREV